MRHLSRLLLIAATCLALPTSAQAATPFTAGSGADPTVAIGPDGSGHVVWQTTDDETSVGYCRISPGGGTCNHTLELELPGPDNQRAGSRAMVFVPAPNEVVIFAGCWNCGMGVTDLTYSLSSNNNGTSFGPPGQIGSGPETNGFGTYLPGSDIWVGASGSHVKAALNDGDDGVQYATGGTFVYGPQVVAVPGTNKLVAATNDLDSVKYGVYKGPAPSIASINNVANWEVDKTLSSPEPDNSDTALNAGPNGVFLTYRNFVAGDSHIGLRHFDPATNTFGGSTFIEGSDPIDDASLGEPDSYQDPAGRIHVLWTTLYEGGRLRYAVSGPSGTGFSAAGTLAASEGFYEPELAAGSDGHGFAVWTPGISGAIRVVPLDPRPESGLRGAAADTTPPSLSGLGIDHRTLAPGQSARFRFRSTEAGEAVLTIEKRFRGKKKKRKGKATCVAAKKRQKKNCTGYRKIGEIRQKVKAGTNTIVFNGRIAGRRLKPGTYRAGLVVTDAAGQVSRTETVRFKVLKPKRRKR
jgi:hypothetical protein